MTTLALTEPGRKLAPLIDHTLLKPDATGNQIRAVCAEARLYGFAAVCVHPCWIELVAAELSGTGVKPCTVIGFPLGNSTQAAKAFEAADAVRRGAGELDMVLAVPAMKERRDAYVREDIRGVVGAAEGRTVKVIIETALLTDEEKAAAARLVVDAGAHFVKTCTGFSGGGATVEDIRLLRRTVGPDFGVKASGGVRTPEDAVRMVQAGATRIGTSSGIAIVTQPPGLRSSAAY